MVIDDSNNNNQSPTASQQQGSDIASDSSSVTEQDKLFSQAQPDEWVPVGHTRWAAQVEYDGANFQGWQVQKHTDRTVQGVVEAALSFVAGSPIQVVCAGRTDTGVSAHGQIIHFDSPVERSSKAWIRGGNTRLPDDVSLVWARQTTGQFHARFSAQWRRYRYQILNRPERCAITRHYMTHWRYPLRDDLMAKAAQSLVGEHDFSSFRSSKCQAHNAKRCIQHLAVEREGDVITIDIQANAFLHHMVRNIVGVLLEIGLERQPISWVDALLEIKDRTQAGVTAPAEGLTFMGVGYPADLQP